jgi:hypothetical protein
VNKITTISVIARKGIKKSLIAKVSIWAVFPFCRAILRKTAVSALFLFSNASSSNDNNQKQQ